MLLQLCCRFARPSAVGRSSYVLVAPLGRTLPHLFSLTRPSASRDEEVSQPSIRKFISQEHELGDVLGPEEPEERRQADVGIRVRIHPISLPNGGDERDLDLQPVENHSPNQLPAAQFDASRKLRNQTRWNDRKTSPGLAYGLPSLAAGNRGVSERLS